jgi:hypothetical protein
MKKLLQRLAIWFYEKMNCRSVSNDKFWKYHMLYSVGKHNNEKIIIAELNRINNQMQLVGTFTGGIFYDIAKEEEILPFCMRCFGVGAVVSEQSNYCHQCGSEGTCTPMMRKDIEYLQENIDYARGYKK